MKEFKENSEELELLKQYIKDLASAFSWESS
mgnify:CR=1 FL=1